MTPPGELVTTVTFTPKERRLYESGIAAQVDAVKTRYLPHKTRGHGVYNMSAGYVRMDIAAPEGLEGRQVVAHLARLAHGLFLQALRQEAPPAIGALLARAAVGQTVLDHRLGLPLAAYAEGRRGITGTLSQTALAQCLPHGLTIFSRFAEGDALLDRPEDEPITALLAARRWLATRHAALEHEVGHPLALSPR